MGERPIRTNVERNGFVGASTLLRLIKHHCAIVHGSARPGPT